MCAFAKVVNGMKLKIQDFTAAIIEEKRKIYTAMKSASCGYKFEKGQSYADIKAVRSTCLIFPDPKTIRCHEDMYWSVRSSGADIVPGVT